MRLLMNKLFLRISERYYLTIINDVFRVLFLILQSFIITGLFILVFKNSQNTNTFKLLLVITSIWFGLINSCQEIVKDKALFYMEKRFGITENAFFLSKQVILSIISFIQVFIMVFGLYLWTSVKFSFTGYFLILVLTSISSVSLGLLISSFSSNTTQALAIAPIITIPQILFNNILIDKTSYPVVEFIRNIMISNWALLYMEKLDDTIDIKAFLYIMIIISFSFLYYILSILFLKLKD